MTAKTKNTPRAKLSLDRSGEIGGNAESEKPVVTQVVEVIEDEILEASVRDPEHSAEAGPSEDPEDQHTDDTRESKRDVISEIFQKNESMGYPDISIHKKRTSKTMVIWAMIVILVAGGIGLGLVLISRGTLVLPSMFASPSPTPTPEPSPTPTPTPSSVNREDITLHVLNGGGVPGAATKMKNFLEEKGYSVEDTGNAKEYTYTETMIVVKPGKEAYITLLEEDLKLEYILGKSEATLPEDASYDVEVIVGKE
ncbi:MAG: LytR C-terminal domain-containing protein [bacterium]|nr:LytR C-terminal domain-containing protein [bacterium]